MSPIDPHEIDAPAGYIPQIAIAFGAPGAVANSVDSASPLPVVASLGAARSTPLAGSANASGSVGPFLPDLARPICLTLSGDWTGTVSVQRSTDGGASRFPLTAGGAAWARFTANANEVVGEESVAGAAYYLDVQLASGTLDYRLEQ